MALSPNGPLSRELPLDHLNQRRYAEGLGQMFHPRSVQRLQRIRMS
jgi:hypothetical protein